MTFPRTTGDLYSSDGDPVRASCDTNSPLWHACRGLTTAALPLRVMGDPVKEASGSLGERLGSELETGEEVCKGIQPHFGTGDATELLTHTRL